MKRLLVINLALSLIAFLTSEAFAQTPDKFYESHRTIKLVVGANLSGSFGIRARLLSQFMGHHIPGTPEIVLQVINGASGVGAAKYIDSAPNDGSIIATFNSALPFYQAMGQPGIPNTNALSWLGSLGRVVSVVVVWHGLGVNSIEDAKEHEVILGATGVRGTTATYPALLNNMFGTKFKIIVGYASNAILYPAIERGEVNGIGGAYWSSFQELKPDWIRDHKIIPLVQINTKKDPSLPSTPLVMELATTDEQRQVLDFILTNTDYEYPYAAPPHMPTERLKTLRRAFDSTMNDTAFLIQAKRLLVDIEPLTGEALQAIVAHILDTPTSVVSRAQAVMVPHDVQRKTGESKVNSDD